MSEPTATHKHEYRYTVYSIPVSWWKRLFGLTDKRVYVGIRSSQQGGELLIFLEHDGFVSINYGRVLSMEAQPVEHAPEIVNVANTQLAASVANQR